MRSSWQQQPYMVSEHKPQASIFKHPQLMRNELILESLSRPSPGLGPSGEITPQDQQLLSIILYRPLSPQLFYCHHTGHTSLLCNDFRTDWYYRR